MVWMFVAAVAMGLVLGLWLRLRVYAVFAASAGVVAACIAFAPFSGWSLLSGLVYCASLVSTLQIGYLAGTALSCAFGRDF